MNIFSSDAAQPPDDIVEVSAGRGLNLHRKGYTVFYRAEDRTSWASADDVLERRPPPRAPRHPTADPLLPRGRSPRAMASKLPPPTPNEVVPRLWEAPQPQPSPPPKSTHFAQGRRSQRGLPDVGGLTGFDNGPHWCVEAGGVELNHDIITEAMRVHDLHAAAGLFYIDSNNEMHLRASVY